MSNTLRDNVVNLRAAQRRLGAASGADRDRILQALEQLLSEREKEILSANEKDLAQAKQDGLDGPLLGRLSLTAAKLEVLKDGIRQLVAAGDPVSRVLRHTQLDDGLELQQVCSPIGVLLVIFESRPDAVIQIGSLALRSGNGIILKGGREATASNRILVDCLRSAAERAGLPPDVVLGVEGREAIQELLDMADCIDLVIPRGSGDLVRAIQDGTRIPVLGHAEGICHVYLDEHADLDKAIRIVVDSKCDYPSACNAVETLLVHRGFLSRLPQVAAALREAGVTLKVDEQAQSVLPNAEAATNDDWRTEYGAKVLSIRIVDNQEDAVDHIHRYGSGHTDAIVTEDSARAEQFLAAVDASSVFHNCSTRFADGYRYGLGAEVGISTGRIHARGPVGIDGLLTTRWLLRGSDNTASDYGPGKKAFKHTPLPLPTR